MRDLSLALFNSCFRIQREASEAAGRTVPLIVENVCGAQKWVGRSRFLYGSFHLWGDLPALMPKAGAIKNGSLGGCSWFGLSATEHHRSRDEPRRPQDRARGEAE